MSTTIIKPLFNITHGAIEPCFLYYYIMEPRQVSHFPPVTARVFYHDDMVSVRIIRSYDNNYGVLIKGGQMTNRVYRVNINGICRQISGRADSFV